MKQSNCIDPYTTLIKLKNYQCVHLSFFLKKHLFSYSKSEIKC